MKLRLLSAFSIALLSMAGVAPAQAATQASAPTFDFDTKGLIVKYAPGVNPVARDGQPTGENAAAADLLTGRDLGSGWFTVGVAGRVTTERAWQIAERLKADPRVASVDLDRLIRSASLGTTQVSRAIISRTYAAIKPATAVRSLKAVDDFSAATPRVARIKLSWQPPLNIGSGKLVGYKVSFKSATGQWTVASANTRSKASTYTIAKGLVPATAYGFKVAALTSSGSAIRAGADSQVVSAIATTAPAAPVLASPLNITAKTPTVSWVAQTPAQAGDLQVSYTASASASGHTTVSCDSVTTSCQLPALDAGISYKVSVVAKNKRGQAQSASEFKPADAYYPKQWHLFGEHGINAPAAWNITTGSKSIVVAVIDTGITKHPDLDSQIVPGYDFVSSAASARDGDGWDSDPTDQGDYSGAESSSWHGTHVAGIIGAAANTIGVIGVAPGVKIQPVRVLGADSGTTSDLISAIRWAAGLQVKDANGNNVPMNPTPAKVINISMGTDGYTPCRLYVNQPGATEVALAAVKAAGVVTVTAAGNFNMPAGNSYPGNCYPTLNVGATGFSGDRAVYSNYSIVDPSTGEMVGVDLSAPGGDHTDFVGAPADTNGRIISTRNDGKTTIGNPSYDYEEGTSMASPVVAGVVALVMSVKPNLTFDDVWLKVISPTLTPFDATSSCASTKACGGGIINAAAAVAMAQTLP
ncbi:MAG: S8 family serine peptidase [Micrococcales bacterium]